jgi:hypothetical protein
MDDALLREFVVIVGANRYVQFSNGDGRKRWAVARLYKAEVFKLKFLEAALNRVCEKDAGDWRSDAAVDPIAELAG